MTTVNVALRLAELAEERPHAPAVVCPAGRDRAGRVAYTHLTFRQLHRDSDRIAAGLTQVGVARGVRTVLMVTPSLDFFALTFALFKIGAVPVLIDPGMGVGNLGVCIGEAEPAAFIGVPKAHVARLLMGWGRSTVRVSVTTGRWGGGHTLAALRKAGGDVPFAQADTRADETAAILFTSGSTGIAKGVVYTHGIFAAQVRLLREVYGIEPGEVDLATFPLFALFGPALGMTAIIPDMDATRPARVNPQRVREAIDNWGVTNLFGSPALLRTVGRHFAGTGVTFPTLRRVVSAGAPVPAGVLETFTKLLAPGVQVFTPYGATESLPVSNIGSAEILGETRHATDRGAGVCVGRPVPGMTARVIPVSDGPLESAPSLPAGEVGEIAVRGPVVTRSYFGRPAATALAKMTDPATGEVEHRTGDLGYLDETGRLWFCGRKAHRVETADGPLHTIPVEGVFNTHPAVARTALVGVRREGRVVPVLCVELEQGTVATEAEVRRDLLEIGGRYAHTKGVRHVLFHPAFPVDVRHNAKIFREKLALWAAVRLGV